MQRRIIFTEDRKDHKDKSFNIKANAPEPPLHKPNAGSASDQDSAEVVEAFEIWMRLEVIPLFRKAIIRLPDLVFRLRRSFAGLSSGCACRFTANKRSAHQSERPFPPLRKTQKEKGSHGGHGVRGWIEQCLVLLRQSGWILKWPGQPLAQATRVSGRRKRRKTPMVRHPPCPPWPLCDVFSSVLFALRRRRTGSVCSVPEARKAGRFAYFVRRRTRPKLQCK